MGRGGDSNLFQAGQTQKSWWGGGGVFVTARPRTAAGRGVQPLFERPDSREHIGDSAKSAKPRATAQMEDQRRKEKDSGKKNPIITERLLTKTTRKYGLAKTKKKMSKRVQGTEEVRDHLSITKRKGGGGDSMPWGGVVLRRDGLAIKVSKNDQANKQRKKKNMGGVLQRESGSK